MYKRSEPIKSLHSVQNHMANVYSSEVCLQTKNFPKISKFFFSKNTPKYDKLSKISNISIKTILKLQTKFGNFGNFGHISDRLRTIHNTCSNLIGSEPLYILPTENTSISSQKSIISRRKVQKLRDQSQYISKNVRALQYWRWACGTCCKQYHMLFYIQMAVVSTAIFFLFSPSFSFFLKIKVQIYIYFHNKCQYINQFPPKP